MANVDHTKESARQVRQAAELTAEQMAADTLTHMASHYEQSLKEGAGLWIQQTCDPSAIEAIGKQSAVFVKTGRRQATIEFFGCLCAFSISICIGLWMINAPKWAFYAGLPVSGAFALMFCLSPDGKH